jgi:hypothetical protein
MAGIDLGNAWADAVWEDGTWATGVWADGEVAPAASTSRRRKAIGFRLIGACLLLFLLS